ncbi:hypothetical protein BC830DRAFT_1233784 [Chytriomyces sp. MP71]|nr:hypothetical protein BC830DRAFT_1233784 [Chytriomyces sp. MP71]
MSQEHHSADLSILPFLQVAAAAGVSALVAVGVLTIRRARSRAALVSRWIQSLPTSHGGPLYFLAANSVEDSRSALDVPRSFFLPTGGCEGIEVIVEVMGLEVPVPAAKRDPPKGRGRRSLLPVVLASEESAVEDEEIEMPELRAIESVFSGDTTRIGSPEWEDDDVYGSESGLELWCYYRNSHRQYQSCLGLCLSLKANTEEHKPAAVPTDLASSIAIAGADRKHPGKTTISKIGSDREWPDRITSIANLPHAGTPGSYHSARESTWIG